MTQTSVVLNRSVAGSLISMLLSDNMVIVYYLAL